MPKTLRARDTVRDSLYLLYNKRVIFVPAFISALLGIIISLSVISLPNMIENGMPVASMMVPFIPVIIIIALVNLFLNALTIKTISDCKKRGFTLSGAARATSQIYVKLLLSHLFVGFLSIVVFSVVALPIIYFSNLILVYAGVSQTAVFWFIGILYGVVVFAAIIYASLRISMYQYAIILNRKGVRESLMFSWNITRGNLIKIFFISILVSMMTSVVSGLAQFIFTLGYSISSANTISIILSGVLTTTFIIPISLAPFTLAYKKLR